MRARDQGRPPRLAEVSHPHNLEHRLASPWLGDELGGGDQDFWRKLGYRTELVLGDNDTPGRFLKGGMKSLQLLSLVLVKHEVEN